MYMYRNQSTHRFGAHHKNNTHTHTSIYSYLSYPRKHPQLIDQRLLVGGVGPGAKEVAERVGAARGGEEAELFLGVTCVGFVDKMGGVVEVSLINATRVRIDHIYLHVQPVLGEEGEEGRLHHALQHGHAGPTLDAEALGGQGGGGGEGFDGHLWIMFGCGWNNAMNR